MTDYATERSPSQRMCDIHPGCSHARTRGATFQSLLFIFLHLSPGPGYHNTEVSDSKPINKERTRTRQMRERKKESKELREPEARGPLGKAFNGRPSGHGWLKSAVIKGFRHWLRGWCRVAYSLGLSQKGISSGKEDKTNDVFLLCCHLFLSFFCSAGY